MMMTLRKMSAIWEVLKMAVEREKSSEMMEKRRGMMMALKQEKMTLSSLLKNTGGKMTEWTTHPVALALRRRQV